MEFTNLGKTGLKVSRICLGCMTYGDPQWRPWILSEADSRPFFERALELGINFFDTADMYSLGPPKSFSQVGEPRIVPDLLALPIPDPSGFPGDAAPARSLRLKAARSRPQW